MMRRNETMSLMQRMLGFAGKVLKLTLPFALILSIEPLAAADGKSLKDWQIRCDRVSDKSEEELCHIFQNVNLKDSGQLVMHIAIGYNKDNKLFALVTLPLGISLPPGIVIEIDSKQAKRLPFDRCEQEGCLVGFEVDTPLEQRLKAGQTLHITFRDKSKRPYRVPASLLGISSGLDALHAQR
jgi:invasion protein IalB